VIRSRQFWLTPHHNPASHCKPSHKCPQRFLAKPETLNPGASADERQLSAFACAKLACSRISRRF
jgi:hypothetical protein